MKLKDLKTVMFVRIRNKQFGMIVRCEYADTIMGPNNDIANLSEYSEDLCFKNGGLNKWDIVEVLDPKYSNLQSILQWANTYVNDVRLTSIWKRETK